MESIKKTRSSGTLGVGEGCDSLLGMLRLMIVARVKECQLPFRRVWRARRTRVASSQHTMRARLASDYFGIELLS